eukprot:Lithocolla_globosa_v1_NODE_497_length_3887_cov_213.445459.p2 type:complete len:191 gc:universal NODE_497_length_3887_cov_213.445459:1510-2082(+)
MLATEGRASQVTSSNSLETSNQTSELSITFFFQNTQDTSLEKHLGETNLVVFGLDLQCLNQFLGGDTPVHKALGQHTNGQDLVTLLEFSKGDTVRVTHTDDTNTFQHTIASELVQHQGGVNDTWLLLFVGNDTTDKVGGGVFQSSHQRGQLLAMALADSDELGTLLAAMTLVFGGNNIVEQLANKRVARL